jgi:CheY-like chemotaxis protein
MAALDLLVVDDEELLSRLIMEAAGFSGFSADIASNGEAALALLQTLPAPPRFVLTDLQMFPMDGYDFVRHLRADHAYDGTVIVACSGYPGDRAAALGAGANHYLSKPFNIDILMQMLSEAAAQ